MGTYTTNYNLFMPSVGEQGWGELVNGNFTTIDTTMKGFDDVLSKMTWDGDNVTFPGSVTATGGFNKTTRTTEAGVVGGIYLSHDYTFASVTGGSSSIKSTTFTSTYKANSICNDVTFIIQVVVGNGWKTGSGYIQINGTEILSYSFGTANKSGSGSVLVTLNDGDIITGYLDSNGIYATTSAIMSCTGYLVNA